MTPFLTEKKEFLTKELLAKMDEYVVAQDDAKHRLIQTLLDGMYNVYPDQGVLGAVMLAGPTGVGKTELVRALSHTLF